MTRKISNSNSTTTDLVGGSGPTFAAPKFVVGRGLRTRPNCGRCSDRPYGFLSRTVVRVKVDWVPPPPIGVPHDGGLDAPGLNF